jgi:hypothetical protein
LSPQKKFEKKSCLFLKTCHAAPMFKTTDKYKIVSSDKLSNNLDQELKKLLDKWLDPEYVRALEQLEKICSKQNYLYN